MDVLVLIDKLDDLVHNAKAVPLTDQVRIDREEIYDILDQMRATIPEEIKQARWIVKERQEMLAEAKRETDRILGEAREQAVREASQTEIVKLAERQAQEIVDDARRQARETRLEMEDWADRILSTLEVNLDKFLTAVKRGRERLHERSQETVVAGVGPREPERRRRQLSVGDGAPGDPLPAAPAAPPPGGRAARRGRDRARAVRARRPALPAGARTRWRPTLDGRAGDHRARSSGSRSTCGCTARACAASRTRSLDVHIDAREYHAADAGAAEELRSEYVVERPARALRVGARRDRARAARADPARARLRGPLPRLRQGSERRAAHPRRGARDPRWAALEELRDRL